MVHLPECWMGAPQSLERRLKHDFSPGLCKAGRTPAGRGFAGAFVDLVAGKLALRGSEFVFAQLAHRLGVWLFKTELEDLSAWPICGLLSVGPLLCLTGRVRARRVSDPRCAPSEQNPCSSH